MFFIKIDQIDLHKYRAEQRFILTSKDPKSPSYVLCVCQSPETYRSWVKKLDDLFKKQNAFIDGKLRIFTSSIFIYIKKSFCF